MWNRYQVYNDQHQKKHTPTDTPVRPISIPESERFLSDVIPCRKIEKATEERE